MSDSNQSDLLTLGDICREIPDVATHRIKYAITTYRIEPRQRAGIIRLWGRDQLDAIRSAIARIAGRREVAHA